MENNQETYEEELSLKAFVVLTRSLESVKSRIEEDIKQLGLNPTEFAVLELIYCKGNQTIHKNSEKILIASSSITYVVDKLEKKNYLIRKPCPKDRRVTHATITEEGKNLMDEVFSKQRKDLKDIFGGLNIEEKEDLIEKLKKLGFYAEHKE